MKDLFSNEFILENKEDNETKEISGYTIYAGGIYIISLWLFILPHWFGWGIS